MKIVEIVDLINKRMGHGNYSVVDTLDYLDACIDNINEEFGISLPLVSNVYANDFDLNDTESVDDYTDDNENNEYTRVPDAYIRGYICNEVASRILEDEDEPSEVYAPKHYRAEKWFVRMQAIFSNFLLEDTETVTLNGDVDELEDTSEDDTALGFYNPYAE